MPADHSTAKHSAGRAPASAHHGAPVHLARPAPPPHPLLHLPSHGLKAPCACTLCPNTRRPDPHLGAPSRHGCAPRVPLQHVQRAREQLVAVLLAAAHKAAAEHVQLPHQVLRAEAAAAAAQLRRQLPFQQAEGAGRGEARARAERGGRGGGDASGAAPGVARGQAVVREGRQVRQALRAVRMWARRAGRGGGGVGPGQQVQVPTDEVRGRATRGPCWSLTPPLQSGLKAACLASRLPHPSCS